MKLVLFDDLSSTLKNDCNGLRRYEYFEAMKSRSSLLELKDENVYRYGSTIDSLIIEFNLFTAV